MVCRMLLRKGRLSVCEHNFLRAVLLYYSAIDKSLPLLQRISEHSCAYLIPDHQLSDLFPVELESLLDQKRELYEQVCESYSQLQLKVLALM
jgi:hypothetical protein